MNALKKISQRTKQLQKRNPKKKYRTLQRQAAKEYKAGKLKTPKRKPAKKKPVKRKAAKKIAPRKKVVRRKRAIVKTTKRRVVRAKRVKVKAYKATRYKRVSGMGKMMPLLAVAALGVGAYLLLKRPAPVASNYGYMPTGNPTRDANANAVLTWATAASLGAAAISKILQALNSKSDTQVQSAAQSPDQFAQSLLGD